MYWKIYDKYNFAKIFKQYEGHKLVIQGEQGDTNVQGNKYKIKEPKMWVFNVILNGMHYDRKQMEDFCCYHGLDIVPCVSRAANLPETIDDIIEMSRGKSVLNKKIQREGLVWRCIEDGQKIISFKVINPDFLLKFNSD